MAPRVAAPTPETAIEVLLAACAPAAEIDFQLVEMVEMRLSTASLHRFRFFLALLRVGRGKELGRLG